jgi:hypothetical protein
MITAKRIISMSKIRKKHQKKKVVKIKSIFKRADRKSESGVDFLDKPMYVSSQLD